MTGADVRIEYATGARLRWWSSAWRYAVVVVFGAISWVSVYGVYAGFVETGLRDKPWIVVLALVDPLAFLIATALLPLRRRAPVTIALATSALSFVSTATAAGPAQLAAVSLATHRRPLPMVANGVVYIAAMWTYTGYFPPDMFAGMAWWAMPVAGVVTYGVPAVLGLYIGARRALVASLHERALEAERERELQVAAAQAGERTRIAREMHDVLAHRISLVAMHAGALAYRDDLDRESVRRTAGLVQDGARRALVELRQVLGVLRAEEPGVEPPQPTLEALPTLVDEARAAGATVDVEGPPDLDAVPALISRTAFRVAQEALTNARKHAPGSAIRVRIDGRPGGLLTVEVRNGSAVAGARDAAVPGSGLGLLGLAERVDLAGGTLDYGPDPHGGYTVRAWLPWEDEEAGDD